MNHDYHNSCKCKYTRSEAGDTCHNWYSTDTAYPELVVRWGELTALNVSEYFALVFFLLQLYCMTSCAFWSVLCWYLRFSIKNHLKMQALLPAIVLICNECMKQYLMSKVTHSKYTKEAGHIYIYIMYIGHESI